MKEFKAIGPNLKTYYYYTNEMASDSNAKGVIVIAPGIEGTGAVYDEIGDYLDSKGYALYTLDEWGYGKTGKVDKKIYKNWKLKDFHFASYNVHALSVLAKKEHPDVPLYLIGNDFGAMLSLYLVREFPDVVDKVVTIGWGAPRFGDYWSLFTSWIRKVFLCDDNEAKLAHFFKNEKYAVRFEKGEKYAWLSSDLSQVQKIKEAGYIDTPGTVGHYFRYYARKVRTPLFMRMKQTDRTTPMLFVSGLEDLSTGKGSSTKSLARYYKMRKFNNVETMLLEGRHELLFEKNRLANVDAILEWLTGETVIVSPKEEKLAGEIEQIETVKAEKSPEIKEETTVIDVTDTVVNEQYAFMEAEEDLLINAHKDEE